MAKAIHLKLEIGPKDPSNCDSFELAGELQGPPKRMRLLEVREDVPFKNHGNFLGLIVVDFSEKISNCLLMTRFIFFVGD